MKEFEKIIKGADKKALLAFKVQKRRESESGRTLELRSQIIKMQQELPTYEKEEKEIDTSIDMRITPKLPTEGKTAENNHRPSISDMSAAFTTVGINSTMQGTDRGKNLFDMMQSRSRRI